MLDLGLCNASAAVACREVVYLSWEELQWFLGFDFSGNSRLAAVRDVFCFCCFTGLRYSDAYKLRRSDLKLDALPPYIAVVTKKTNDRLHIELNKYALAILAKYSAAPLPARLLTPLAHDAHNAHARCRCCRQPPALRMLCKDYRWGACICRALAVPLRYKNKTSYKLSPNHTITQLWEAFLALSRKRAA